MTTDTERQEERTYETLPERTAAKEATQRLLIEVVRENGRRADENYRALDAKTDNSYKALCAKIDDLNKRMRRLYCVLLVYYIGMAAAIIGANYFGN